MPAQDRIGRDDGRQLHQRPAAEGFAFGGENSPLSIREEDPDLGVLELDDTYVDRVNSQWLGGGTRQPIGYCQRLPLWDALEVIEQQSVEGAS